MNIECDKEEDSLFKVVFKGMSYKDSYNSCILHFFDRKTLRRLLSRRQYEHLVKIAI